MENHRPLRAETTKCLRNEVPLHKAGSDGRLTCTYGSRAAIPDEGDTFVILASLGPGSL